MWSFCVNPFSLGFSELCMKTHKVVEHFGVLSGGGTITQASFVINGFFLKHVC